MPNVLKCCNGPLLEYIVTLLERKERVKRYFASPCVKERRFFLIVIIGEALADHLLECLMTDCNLWLRKQSLRAGRGCVNTIMIFCVHWSVE